MIRFSKCGSFRFPLKYYRYLFMATTAFGLALMLMSYHRNRTMTPLLDLDSRFTLETEGCTISYLQPFDESIRKFISKPTAYPCSPSTVILQSNSSHIWVDESYLKHFNIEKDKVNCCYKGFYRPSSLYDQSPEKMGNKIEYKPCVSFSRSIKPTDEFVRVTCKYQTQNHEHGSRDQFFIFTEKKKVNRPVVENAKSQKKPSYNVLLIGLDSISRLNLYRTMPKTVSFLQKKGAVELMAYNKLGDNTFPNFVPLLMGIKYGPELTNTCWNDSQTPLDTCPFVWNLYRDAGYYTAFAEDCADLDTFNYGRVGFRGTPTDYYLYPFMVESNHVIGNTIKNSNLCFGHKYFYEQMLEHGEDLARVLKSSRLFALLWEVTMSHDFLNLPMLIDSRFEEFLIKLDSSQYLDETVLIFMSDHGIRFGEIRATKQGRLEERLPFVFIVTPPSLREKYPLAYENLLVNRNRLTTPLDLHATLVDLVNLDTINNENIALRSQQAYSKDRNISLFLPVPQTRTCHTADIDEQWCTCHSEKKINTSSEIALEVASQLVRKLNDMVGGYPECARLELDEIKEVTELVAGWQYDDIVWWQEFLIVVRTQPGGGLFEGTLRGNSEEYVLAGGVSRINRYGEQSRCMHDTTLQLYCYCLELNSTAPPV